MTHRDTDTTLMLCLATVLITLSHLDAFVPDPRIATGGAIGNALFFFLSGFGLAKSLNAEAAGGVPPSLPAYLRKRVLRLYPAVFIVAVAMLAAGLVSITGPADLAAVFVWPTPFWFVSAVMAFYVPVFYLARLRPAGIAAAMALLLIPYGLFYGQLDLSIFSVEGRGNDFTWANHFKWINYFGITLMGCLVARLRLKPRLGASSVALLLGGLLLFLVAKLTLFRFGLGELQFLFQALLYPIGLGCFHVFASEALLKPLRATPLFPAVALLGGLTLEIYLTQTAWIRWLDTQSLPEGPFAPLALALVPLLVFSVLTRWASHWMGSGVSRLFHPTPA